MSKEIPEIHELVRLGKVHFGDRKVLHGFGKASLSFRELSRLVGETARNLRLCGLGPDSRIAIVLPNGPEMATAFLATAAACCSAPLNPGYRAEEYEFYLDDLGAKALIVAEADDGAALSVARRRNIAVLRLRTAESEPAGVFTLHPESRGTQHPPLETSAMPLAGDTALVLHTSGTTSRPKIVPLSQRNLVCSAGHIAGTLRLSPEDRCLNVMPLFHIHGLVGVLLSSVFAGASVVCSPGFLAPRFLEWLAEWEPTWYSAVPTMHQAILARARDAGSALPKTLRVIRSSSSALPPQVMLGLEAVFGVPVIESYGMTEASHQMASNPLPPGIRKPGSVGIAAGPRVAIMNAEGGLLPGGETGEVVIEGPNVTRGYSGNPEANAAAFTNGWFRTGDQGYLDDDGYLFLTGRLKELINRGGEKLSPREIDEALLDHPAVAQALAFAMPDEKLGEEVAAAVVLKEGAAASEQELREFTATKLADFKVPRRIVLLPEIPKGPTGKLQRIGLAEKLGLSATVSPVPASAAEYLAPRTPLEERLCGLFEEVLLVRGLGADADFFEAGGDSITAARFLSLVAAEYGGAPGLVRFADLPTPRSMAAWLDGFQTASSRGVTGSSGSGAPNSPLVSLQPHGDGNPLVLIHGAGGNVLFYRKLAESLGNGRPVFGLQAKGADGAALPDDSFQRMAESYVEAVFQAGLVQRPVILGGYCFGAYMAAEMARRIEERGGEVQLVIAFDTDGEWRTVATPGAALRFHLRQLGRRSFPEKVAYFRERAAFRVRRRRIWRNAPLLRRNLERGQPLTVDQAFQLLSQANGIASERHRPQPFAAPLLYVRGVDGPPRDPSVFWSELALGGITALETPGRDLSMFASPAVETLAERLRERLAATELSRQAVRAALL